MAAFIASQREQHGVPQAVSCRALGVSQSWFYKWKDGELPPRAARRERLKAEIARLFAQREGKDGSPRITAALRDAGLAGQREHRRGPDARAGPGRPARRRAARRTTRPGKGRWRAPDLVKRKFAAGGINRKWYGDGTEIATGEGKLYLDSRAGHGLAPDPRARARRASRRGRWPTARWPWRSRSAAAAVPGVVFHTDQGSEYTAGTLPAGLRAAGRRASRWAGRARRWTTRSSSPGTPRWSSSCGRCASSPPGRRRGPRSPRGSRTTTTSAGTRRSGMRSPGGLRAVAGGKGRRVTAAGPLRGPGKEAAAPPLALLAPAKGTGPPLRPQGCCASPCGRRPCGPPLTPGTPAAPGSRKSGQATACPARTRAQQGQPVLARTTNRSLHGLRGTPRRAFPV